MDRLITTFNKTQQVMMLSAFSYGHTIPITLTIDDDDPTKRHLQLNNTIPVHLLEQAKRVCWSGYYRYCSEVLPDNIQTI